MRHIGLCQRSLATPSGRCGPASTSAWTHGLVSSRTRLCTSLRRSSASVACGAMKKSELNACRVATLREMCEARGLPSDGLKAALVERLLQVGTADTSHVDEEEMDGSHAIHAAEEETDGSHAIHAIHAIHATEVEEDVAANQATASTHATEDTQQRQPYTVTWLGTSSGAPTSRRNVSSMALRLDEENVVLVDCGEGTRNQMRVAKISPAHVSHIFITHLHGDHCFGIAGMLLAIMKRRRGTPREGEPVYIYGPPELHRLVAASCKAAQMTLTMPVIVTGFALDPRKEVLPPRAVIPNEKHYLVALQAPDQKVDASKKQLQRLEALQRAYEQGSDQIVQNGLTWSVDVLEDRFNVRVTSAQLQHRMPCWGYVFENIQDGRKVVLLGDTCNSEAIARAAMNCDVLSHEATYKVGMEDKARIATHSTSAQAGSFAGRIQAKALVLTHFSARYDQVDKYKKMFVKAREKGMSVADMQSSNVSVLKEEAKEAAGEGVNVYLANDYYRFHVR